MASLKKNSLYIESSTYVIYSNVIVQVVFFGGKFSVLNENLLPRLCDFLRQLLDTNFCKAIVLELLKKNIYSEFSLRLAIGFYMLTFQPPVNFYFQSLALFLD
jgi:hypothetical protein